MDWHIINDGMTAMNPAPEQVKAARVASGLTQAQFGAILSAKVRTVQDWESGARNMPASKWELWQIKSLA